MFPVRRNFSFKLPVDRVRNWHPEGAAASHFFNAMSLFFPVGERFFITSVRNYQHLVKDPELLATMRAFIGQEAMHGREHQAYNEALHSAGLPAKALENLVARLLGGAQAVLSPAMQLSVTIALEHFTAILADQLLANPELLGDAEGQFKRLWLWHAHEETEHKAVAYDVWNYVNSPGLNREAQRYAGMVIAGTAFVVLVGAYTAVLIEHDLRQAQHTPRLKTWAHLSRFLTRPRGLLRQGLAPLLQYFRPGFHPWQHDNRDLLRLLESQSGDGPALARAA
jgi:predicted metal-dependent hydrolase